MYGFDVRRTSPRSQKPGAKSVEPAFVHACQSRGTYAWRHPSALSESGASGTKYRFCNGDPGPPCAVLHHEVTFNGRLYHQDIRIRRP